MENEMSLIHHVVKNGGDAIIQKKWQSPKWKDPKTSNVETQAQGDVDGVRVREGIGLRWSQGF